MWFVFDDPEFYKHTLIVGSDVYAIICFRRYWKNNFVAFFLISEDMPAIHARELKEFILQAVIDLRADRVQTDSVDDAALNKWHNFLGFTLEGKREKMIYGKDFNMWGFLRGRDF
jgi:hypothetical protein